MHKLQAGPRANNRGCHCHEMATIEWGHDDHVESSFEIPNF